MPDKVVKDKVLCYIRARWEPASSFGIPTTATKRSVSRCQPAASVPDESPEDAALREAREETGLKDFTIVKKLGLTEYDISPYRFEIQQRHVFHLELDRADTGTLDQPGRSRRRSRSRRTSSASGFRWRPRTSCSPVRAPCWAGSSSNHKRPVGTGR